MIQRKIKPELLAPAGNWASLRAALDSGADSVYFGIKGMNMRQLADNFDVLELKKVMALVHGEKKKGYLALNILVKDQELAKIQKILKTAKKAGVDAVILWDMAIFSLAKDLGLPVHLSTQASVSNFEALKFFARQGAKRIVLARECSLEDIRGIARKIKKEGLCVELETFIHGAMCVSISGRCFLSAYSYGKSANRGACLQPCRREYVIQDKSGGTEYVLGEDYILSPKDLCTIDFIDELIEAGIGSFKIEGRMRSAEYAKVVTSVYRKAMDAYGEGELTVELKADLKRQLQGVYNRGFSSGFYFGTPQDISRGFEHTKKKFFLGEVNRFYPKISVAEIQLRNRSLKAGDQIMFIGKNTPALSTIAGQLQCDHRSVDEALKGVAVAVKLPFIVRPKDKVFLWK
ncbi:MAG TPA: hypothetical protein DD723_05325 [Candidatus Omnitrophica bacterium]|nr:hypothetical protein [Candidatus Omnitrophota bacterium]